MKFMYTRAAISFALILAMPAGMADALPDTKPTTQQQFDYLKLPHDGRSTEELIRSGNKGDFESAMILGCKWYLLDEPGTRVPAEVLEARHWSEYWFRKAAETGHPAPRLYLEASKYRDLDIYELLEDETKTPEELKNLVKECEKLAEQGDIEAINALCHFLPEISDENLNKWYQPLRDKAKKGNIDAKAIMAKNMLFGRATSDAFLAEGAKYAGEAAQVGNLSALNTLGQQLTIDLLGTDLQEKGLELLKKASDQGHIGAMENLLLSIYNEDDPDEKASDRKEYEDKLRQTLCERGQLDILLSEGALLTKTEQTAETGLKYWERAANMGSFSALDHLYKYYNNEARNIPANSGKCFEYATMLAEKGSALGYLHLANLYEKGTGVEKNSRQAHEYITKAMQMGLSDAHVELARFILRNKDFGESYEKALSILKDLSNDPAPPMGTFFLLGYMHEGGLGTKADDKMAYEFYTIGAEEGDPKAMNNLASMYEVGRGVTKDLEEAKKWYSEAANVGDTDAKANYDRLLKQEKQPQ